MAVAKRRGRQKPAKIEQRKVKGRSEDQSEDFRKNKQYSRLSPICIGQAQVEEKTYKRRSQSAFSGTLAPACMRMRALSLSLSLALSRSLCSLALSLSLSFSLSLPFSRSLPPSPASFYTLFSSSLGFSCYLLNKIEL